MAEHRRVTGKERDKRHPTPVTDPRQRGLQAFRSGHLDEAIDTWSLLAQNDAQIAAALAEARFRRALIRQPEDGQVEDMRCAVSLAPHDLRYRYHMGLALHRVGDLSGAVEAYRAVLQHDPHWPGAGMMLALAVLEQGNDSHVADLPSSSTEVVRIVTPVQALLRGEMPPPDGEEPISRLWQGLGLLQRGDRATREILDDPRPLPSRQATVVRRYYQGVAVMVMSG